MSEAEAQSWMMGSRVPLGGRRCAGNREINHCANCRRQLARRSLSKGTVSYFFCSTTSSLPRVYAFDAERYVSEELACTYGYSCVIPGIMTVCMLAIDRAVLF
jgi:hypothetical protein